MVELLSDLIFELNQMTSDKIMDGRVDSKVKCYDETWNYYLKLCLLKIVVVLSNHENCLRKIFLPKTLKTCYLIS